VFTGNGRDTSTFLPAPQKTHKHSGVRLLLFQQFAPGWEMRLSGDINQLTRLGSIVLPIGGVNYANRTISSSIAATTSN